MTAEEIQAEKKYRIDERLALCCGARNPTEAEMRLAKKEADEWEREFMKNNKPQPS